jgi:hypothetical protein
MPQWMLRYARSGGIALLLLSCSNGTIGLSADGGAMAARPAPIPNSPGDAQNPATGTPQAVADWLASGAYRQWRCEPAAHETRSSSPHRKNRVCSNRKVAEHGEGEFPVGSASVKELYDDLGALSGHAISIKTGLGAEPAWVWFEVQGSRVSVNARGDAAEASSCTSCHRVAGSDAEHGGHDFVYTAALSQRR